jgi:hypothetical protein
LGTGGIGGAAAGASVAATAAVVIGGLAAGALIGIALRHYFGEARAVRAEEAADAGAKALLETRRTLEARLGRRLTAAEAKKLFRAYEANLAQLGFTQDAGGRWSRQRSGLEKFLG